jgi:hypothetical protein
LGRHFLLFRRKQLRAIIFVLPVFGAGFPSVFRPSALSDVELVQNGSLTREPFFLDR